MAEYINVDGVQRQIRSKLVGQSGKWIEAYSDEVPYNDPILEISSVSYRAGSPLQGQLELTGWGLSGTVRPYPQTFAFYPLRGNLADSFENFGTILSYGITLPTAQTVDGALAFVLDGSQEQHLDLPSVGGAAYDLLGFISSNGSKYWELDGKFKASVLPTGLDPIFVAFSGTVSQNLAVWFDASGTLYARLKNGPTVLQVSIANAVTLNTWCGFALRFTPGSVLRLDVFGRGYDQIPVTGFPYWAPALETPIQLGTGIKPGSSVTADKFFLSSNTHSAYTISTDGLELTGTGTAYRNAQPSADMAPNTGRYYIEILNRSTYDLQFGVTDVFDLTQPPGVVGWAVNTINGRLFAKQTGGGTAWTTTIPYNSVIGLVYDSNQGLIEVYVDGVKRTDPFAAGTITTPVRFVIGGRALDSVTNLFNPLVRQSSLLWTNQPAGTLNEIPYSLITQNDSPVYFSGALRDYVFRNQPQDSDNRLHSVIDPAQSFSVTFADAGGIETDVTNLLLTQNDAKAILSVPQLADGNYYIQAHIPNHVSSTRRFFSVRSFTHKTTNLNIDFAVDNIDKVRFNLMAAHKQWGGVNGGVVKENVRIASGRAELTALGDLYTGPVLGVDRTGAPSGFNTRIGACLVTRHYYGPGRYRVLVKPAELPGVANALWSFHYEEGYPGSPLFDLCLADGLHQQGSIVDGFYIVRNHEIDIEFPTALKTDLDQESVKFTQARFNTWRGELRNWDVPNNDVPVSDPMYSPTNDPAYWSEYTDNFLAHGINLADGQYHEMGYDWHLGADPRVEFYIDNVLQHTIRTHIPDIPSRFWIGVWFPSATIEWAGRGAAWVQQMMYVRSISIQPYASEQSYVRSIVETYPNDTYRPIG